jgi:hypothetical protein
VWITLRRFRDHPNEERLLLDLLLTLPRLDLLCFDDDESLKNFYFN